MGNTSKQVQFNYNAGELDAETAWLLYSRYQKLNTKETRYINTGTELFMMYDSGTDTKGNSTINIRKITPVEMESLSPRHSLVPTDKQITDAIDKR